MIFIVAKFDVKPEFADQWPALVAEFTSATRTEAGNLWFEWSRSLEDRNQYVLVEAFRDESAGAAHVQSEHFVRAMEQIPEYISRVPDIVNAHVEGTAWSRLGELKMPDDQ